MYGLPDNIKGSSTIMVFPTILEIDGTLWHDLVETMQIHDLNPSMTLHAMLTGIKLRPFLDSLA